MEKSLDVFLLLIVVPWFAPTSGTSGTSDAVSQWQKHCGESMYADAGIAGGANPSSFIVGGWQARRNEFPWQVALVTMDIPQLLFCGGSIISPKHIITAAHCVVGTKKYEFAVAVSMHNIYLAFDDDLYSVSAIIIHPDYNRDTLKNDIALVELDRPITHSKVALSICLPTSPSSQFYKTPLIVSGWGTTQYGGNQSEVLLYTHVDLMSLNACRVCMGWNVILHGMLCAGKCGGNEADSCQGDSGGPLFRKREVGSFELTGIVSWGHRCASIAPGVYTDVYKYIDWIQSFIHE